jgi:AcrR family transcriptional regulator
MAVPFVPLSGRRAQAARNDEAILTAARDVFVDDPSAPIAAVSQRAGVGISALYRRYPSKEVLLGRLCSDGQAIYIAEAERALADDGDPWEAYANFLRRIVAADTHSLTVRLAGTFVPTERHMQDAELMRRLSEQLFGRTRAAGAIRPDVTELDIAFLMELLAQTRLGNQQRTAELRRRFLGVILDGLRPGSTVVLPGRAPSWNEQLERWAPAVPADDRD